MPTPFAPPSIVAHNARAALHPFIRAPATPPSLALRARLVLRAAASDRPRNWHIRRECGCANHTTGQWRRRDRDLGLAGLHDAVRSGRPKVIRPPPRGHVVSVASTWPHEHDRPVTRWSLAESVPPWLDPLPTASRSRSSLWRILPDVALTPHQSPSWLHSPDAAFEPKAQHLCQLDAGALSASEPGRWVGCCEEKPGLHGRERQAPTKPARPGHDERRAQEDMRRGPRGLIPSLAVATGQSAWPLGATRTATDVVAHLHHASHPFPRRQRSDGVLDNWHPHWRRDGCRLVARGCQVPLEPAKLKKGVPRRAFVRAPSQRHGLHGTPQPGSWLNQAARCFGTWPRRFLARGRFRSRKDVERRLERLLQDDHARHAQPSRWTYSGEPLVRATPCSRTRRQPRWGRAWASPRPKRFERLLYAPRPSRRPAV